MTLKSQLAIAFSISFFGLIGFSLMAFLIQADKLIHFDQTIITFIQRFESPFLTSVMKFFTFIGSTAFIVCLSIIMIIFLKGILKHRTELIFFVSVLIGSGILNQVLKQAFHRARPDLHRIIEETGYSFPSGHAMTAFTVYSILTFLLWSHIRPRWGRTIIIFISIVFIFLIGTSRIYLGVHYPSDIIGGYFASGCWVGVAIWFFQRYKERKFVKRKQNL